MISTHSTERAAREAAADRIKQGYPVAVIYWRSCPKSPRFEYLIDSADDVRGLVPVHNDWAVLCAGKYYETANEVRILLQEPTLPRPDPFDPLTMLLRVARIRVERARRHESTLEPFVRATS